MGTDFQQAAMLADAAIPTDVEMITDGAKATGFVIAQKLFYRIVAVATGSGTVQNDVAYGVDGVHQQTALYLGQKAAFVRYFFTGNG